jgi:hypothetical protein
VKKGRHRRFEEARKLKQSGPVFSDLLPRQGGDGPEDDDEYAKLAEKYGVEFEDDDDEDEER